MKDRPALLGILALLLLFSCGAGDRWTRERELLIGQEQLFRDRPPEAINYVGMATESNASQGGVLPGKQLGTGGEATYDLPATVSIDDVTDFYLVILAKEGHQNINLYCNLGIGNVGRTLSSARWVKHYGYVVEIRVVYRDQQVDGPTVRSGPLQVGLVLNTSRRMIPTTAEDPALQCGSYPLQRMRKVLAPFGLVPFQAPKEFRTVHGIFGERNKQRTTPPHTGTT
jgi:hypothetical protein